MSLPGTQGTASQPFGFAGQQQDPTGLVYLRARYYAPALGRFMSRDPLPGNLAVPLTLNRFTYVRNDPTLVVDPSGLVAIDPDAGNAESGNFTRPAAPGKSHVLQPPNCVDPSANCGTGAPALCFPIIGCLAWGGIIKDPGKHDGGEGGSGGYRYPIRLTEQKLGEIIDTHTEYGNLYVDGTSYFDPTLSEADIRAVIMEAGNSRPVAEGNGTYYRTYTYSGGEVGWDRVTGEETSTVTVITDRFGNVVTAHPGGRDS